MMLQNLLDCLQQSSPFNCTVQQQLDRETPDMDLICRSCLDCIKRTPDSSVLMEQLVDANIQGAHADHTEAMKHKQEGATTFRQGAYRQAALLYTEALAYLDRTSASGAALATDILCNRALTLLRQSPSDPEAALLDASAAIDCSKANCKAWYRRACSHEALQNYTAARHDAAMAFKLSSGTQRADCHQLLQQLQASPQASASSDDHQDLSLSSAPAHSHTELQQPFRVPPNWLPSAAPIAPQSADTRLAVNTSTDQGRHLVVAQDVAAGSVLWSEEPFAHLLLKQHRKQRCSMCLKPVRAHKSFSCPACPLVHYCSPSCCQRDPFHTAKGRECGLPWSLLLPADVVLATRVAGKLSQDASPCAQHIQSLQTHLKQTSLATLTELVLLATLAAVCCSQQSSSPSLSPGSILTALLQVHINGVAIVPQEHTDARDRIALAVYPIASLMNHSCQPNVALCFDGSILSARAVVPIKAGGPILHCYGPQKGALVTPLRPQQLQEQYHFACQCQACQAGFDESEQEMVGLRCLDRGCDGVTVPMQAVAAGLCSTSALPSGIGNDCCNRCRKCWSQELADRVHPLWAALVAAKSERESVTAQLQSCDAADAGTLKAASQCLLGVSQVQQQYLSKANQLTAQTNHQLAEVLAASGDIEQAALYCQKVLNAVQCTYPSNSTAVAYQQLKLADLLRMQGQADAAHEQAAAAVSVLQRHFGDTVQHPFA